MAMVQIAAIRVVMKIIEAEATYQDGLVTMPAYLFEALHNIVLPGDKRHEYTEERVDND